MLTFTIAAVAALLPFVTADSSCRFAAQFDQNAIITNETVREQFLYTHAKWESHFCRHIGIDNSTWLTFDGQRLDATTGMPWGDPHLFSAPSKESLHVAVLARVLDGHTRARAMYTVEEALFLLRRKAESYERFHNQFPGFGGFFPWFALDRQGGITPTWDWQNRVPSLDNGELFWAAFAVAEVLRTKYPEEYELGRRWEAVWRRMVDTALAVFYDGNGNLRTVTNIKNQSWPVENNTYSNPPVPGYLNDPYEGELFTVMVYLFTNLSAAEKHQLWVNKRGMLQRATLQVDATTEIAVQKGFWFSAHETWKYLFLPYYLAPSNWRVFHNGERARTHYAKMQRSPGLWASVNGPLETNAQSFNYYSDCGVPPIAFETVTHDMVTTPYGGFPLFLLDEGIAAAWLHQSLSVRRGQNCFGSTESFNISGTMVAPLTTWDSKITTVVAAMRGGVDIVEQGLRRLGVLDQFVDVVEYEWARVFGNASSPLPGEQLPLVPPPSFNIPELLPDFTSCAADGLACPDLSGPFYSPSSSTRTFDMPQTRNKKISPFSDKKKKLIKKH